jgi:phospholipase/carboxylesterase
LSLRTARADRPNAKATLALLHGLGSHEYDLLELHNLLRAPVRTVAARAPYAYGPGFAWFDLDFSVSPPAANLEQAVASLGLLNQWLDVLRPEGKLILGGFSQGAIMTLAAIGQDPSRFAGAVLLSGAPIDPSLVGSLEGLPVFVSHGDDDEVLPASGADEIVRLLESRGARVVSFRYEAGHTITEENLEDLDLWLEALLCEPPS